MKQRPCELRGPRATANFDPRHLFGREIGRWGWSHFLPQRRGEIGDERRVPTREEGPLRVRKFCYGLKHQQIRIISAYHR
jgi:hypothetical protein